MRACQCPCWSGSMQWRRKPGSQRGELGRWWCREIPRGDSGSRLEVPQWGLCGQDRLGRRHCRQWQSPGKVLSLVWKDLTISSQEGDRVIGVDQQSLESLGYAAALELLQKSGPSVTLLVSQLRWKHFVGATAAAPDQPRLLANLKLGHRGESDFSRTASKMSMHLCWCK